MRGHLKERSPNHWAIVIDVRDPETGKRKRKWHSFKGTKREAQVERCRLIADMAAGNYVEASARLTVAAFLDRWIEHMKGQVSPRSHERYAELCHKNLAPLLGSVALTKLQPAHISQAYAKALASGRRDGQGGLSPRTVTHMHRVLREALQQALRWQVLARNPADVVRPPKVERRQMAVLNIDATAEFIDVARGTSLFIAILLGALCGLRRGEIVALRWRSIDLDRGQLSVVASAEQTDEGVREKETKSGNNRSVALSPTMIEELRQYRIRQAEQLLKLGVRLTDEHHVVTREDGLPLQPRSLSHAFTKFMHQHPELKRIRLHDLRHTCATHMLASGIHPKIAQERLGHSSVSVTIDLYSHVLPNMQGEAVNRVDATLREALNRRRNKG
jgi:integrase